MNPCPTWDLIFLTIFFSNAVPETEKKWNRRPCIWMEKFKILTFFSININDSALVSVNRKWNLRPCIWMENFWTFFSIIINDSALVSVNKKWNLRPCIWMGKFKILTFFRSTIVMHRWIMTILLLFFQKVEKNIHTLLYESTSP